MSSELNTADIQHIWIAIIWARQHGFTDTQFDNKWLHAAEEKLQARFEELEPGVA